MMMMREVMILNCAYPRNPFSPRVLIPRAHNSPQENNRKRLSDKKMRVCERERDC